VTLTANSGFTFTGLTAATINTQAASISNNTGAAVTLSYQFAATSSSLVITFTPVIDPIEKTLTPPEGVNLSDLKIKYDGSDNITLTITGITGPFEWFIDNVLQTGKTTGTFTLESSMFNRFDVGIRKLTVEVVIAGVPYGLTIPFTVESINN